MTVRQVFGLVGLSPMGPVPWLTPIPETRYGVYVVALTKDPDGVCFDPVCIDHLSEVERDKWNLDEPVLYIGMTDRPLSERVGEFYNHVYGNPSPHSGGQRLLLLDCPRWVYWSPADKALIDEKAMIREFKRLIGRFPYANRRL